MKLSLIICTYKRAGALEKLLNSVQLQEVYPDEILIIDGSPDDETEKLFKRCQIAKLSYYKVSPEHRGLTRQRNYGIERVGEQIDIVCFLDDDTVLEREYFAAVIKVFRNNPDITGVGGISVNENRWEPKKEGVIYSSKKYYEWEGYVCKEGSRNVARNYLGLSSDLAPGKMPEFGHGRTMGYPLTGKIYEVDLLVGMSMAFRKNVVESINFSTYFEGYGLYEDADYSIRALQFGRNVIATSARLMHLHEASGRPDLFKYGKMVTRNGYYVWRVKYPKPSFKAKLKWHAITWLLIGIRAANMMNTPRKKEAFAEVRGRISGWFSLLIHLPK